MSAVRIVQGTEAVRRELIARAGFAPALDRAALDRAAQVFGERLGPAEFARRVVREVGAEGDAAVRRIARAVGDHVPARLAYSASELADARARAPRGLAADLRLAAERIRRFHRKQLPSDFMDETEGLGQRWTPVDRVGLVVPSQAAPLASSVLMAAIPARVAGVKELVLCAAPRPDGIAPAIALAAEAAAVDRVFGVGGAQAVAALAQGTETVPRCDVVAGPGNVWVTMAKREVYGLSGVDLLPGPTETLIVADAGACAADAAADLIAQAEHGGPASPILLTDSVALAQSVAAAIERQLRDLPLAAVARRSFTERGGIGVVPSLQTAMQLANEYAPEHLCLLAANPQPLLDRVRHAGGVFVGAHSPEVLGDYVAGPSHVMPTGGTARFTSPCSVFAFLKSISIVRLPHDAARALAPVAARLARAEGLEGHARAAERRAPFGPTRLECSK